MLSAASTVDGSFYINIYIYSMYVCIYLCTVQYRFKTYIIIHVYTYMYVRVRLCLTVQ